MVSFFELLFFGSALGLGLLTFFGPKEASIATSEAFRKFQRIFLTVFLIMMAADWMQGPYVYRLYSHYGFTMAQNGQLFIAGFGSSMIFGTIVGSMTDKYGRKLGCIMYGITYMASCFTKHFNDFNILMVGRLLGGLATSILFSAFESWMVSEHNKQGFSEEWLSSTFSLMTVGNGIVAVLSGWAAQAAVDVVDHPVAPFDLSFVFLAIGTVFIWFSWGENYGDARGSTLQGFKDAYAAIQNDRRVFLLGAIQSLFEGAMYTFVFMWTPTLEAGGGETIPHGVIFATFMICASIGGSIFKVLIARQDLAVFMRSVFALAAVAMLVPVLTSNYLLIYAAFLVFEICVGIFWPGMGTLRSRYVPEETRATTLNLFRVPLNFMVCLILLYVGDLSIGTVFIICTAFQALCAVLAGLLITEIQRMPKKPASVGAADTEPLSPEIAVSH